MRHNPDTKALPTSFDEKALHANPFGVLYFDHKSLLEYASNLARWLQQKYFNLRDITPHQAFDVYLDHMKLYGVRTHANKIQLFAVIKYLKSLLGPRWESAERREFVCFKASAHDTMQQAQSQFNHPHNISHSEVCYVSPKDVVVRFVSLMSSFNDVQHAHVSKSGLKQAHQAFIRLVLLVSSGKTHRLKDDHTLYAAIRAKEGWQVMDIQNLRHPYSSQHPFAVCDPETFSRRYDRETVATQCSILAVQKIYKLFGDPPFVSPHSKRVHNGLAASSSSGSRRIPPHHTVSASSCSSHSTGA